MGDVSGGQYGPTSVSSKRNFLISPWTNIKTFHIIKFAKTFKKNKMCTSHLSHPTEHPQAGPNLDLLRNPNQHMRSHQSSASGASTSQKMNHYN
jgi:hypothetical protein